MLTPMPVGLPLTRNDLVGGSRGTGLGDVGQFVEASVHPEVEVGDLLVRRAPATSTFSRAVLTMPDTTAFCWAIAVSTSSRLSLRFASFCEKWRSISRPGLLEDSTLPTSGERRNSARRRSRASRGVKPSSWVTP